MRLATYDFFSMNAKGNILVIDDEEGPRESLKMVLGSNYNIFAADQGAAALEILAREPIDLVTLDLKMAGLSGIQVLEKIKQRDPDVDAIIITGYGSMDTAIEGLRLGAFDYIGKPFDIDQIKLLVKKALERRNAKARLRALKSDFLANTSHELRTPLSVIMGYVSLLLDQVGGSLSEKQKRVLEKVYRSSEEFLDLIENVLCLNSINAGTLVLSAEAFSLQEVVKQAISRYAGIAREKEIQVLVELPEEQTIVRTDQDKISRIFRNLLSNALKFTPTGGQVTIRASTAVLTNFLEIQVWDSGIGIQPQDIDAAFQPFWQSDSSSRRQFPGLGLGLTVTRHLADLLGGSVEITSQPGAGTRVHVGIPCDGKGGGPSSSSRGTTAAPH